MSRLYIFKFKIVLIVYDFLLVCLIFKDLSYYLINDEAALYVKLE